MSKNKSHKNVFEQAVSEMKHFLIGAVFVLVFVGIVPAFAEMSMDMSSMGTMMPSSGYTMPSYTMPPPPPPSMPTNSTDMMSQIMSCPFLGGQMVTGAECKAAWDAAQRSSARSPEPAPTSAPTPPSAETPKEAAPEGNAEDLEAIEELEAALKLKAEQAAPKQKLADLAKQIDSKIIMPNVKLLGHVKGKNTKKLIKSAVKAIEKSLTQGRDKSCAGYPTEIFKLKCELLFTNASKEVKQASLKKNPTPADFNKILETLQKDLNSFSVD